MNKSHNQTQEERPDTGIVSKVGHSDRRFLPQYFYEEQPASNTTSNRGRFEKPQSRDPHTLNSFTPWSPCSSTREAGYGQLVVPGYRAIADNAPHRISIRIKTIAVLRPRTKNRTKTRTRGQDIPSQPSSGSSASPDKAPPSSSKSVSIVRAWSFASTETSGLLSDLYSLGPRPRSQRSLLAIRNFSS